MTDERPYTPLKKGKLVLNFPLYKINKAEKLDPEIRKKLKILYNLPSEDIIIENKFLDIIQPFLPPKGKKHKNVDKIKETINTIFNTIIHLSPNQYKNFFSLMEDKNMKRILTQHKGSLEILRYFNAYGCGLLDLPEEKIHNLTSILNQYDNYKDLSILDLARATLSISDYKNAKDLDWILKLFEDKEIGDKSLNETLQIEILDKRYILKNQEFFSITDSNDPNFYENLREYLIKSRLSYDEELDQTLKLFKNEKIGTELFKEFLQTLLNKEPLEYILENQELILKEKDEGLRKLKFSMLSNIDPYDPNFYENLRKYVIKSGLPYDKLTKSELFYSLLSLKVLEKSSEEYIEDEINHIKKSIEELIENFPEHEKFTRDILEGFLLEKSLENFPKPTSNEQRKKIQEKINHLVENAEKIANHLINDAAQKAEEYKKYEINEKSYKMYNLNEEQFLKHMRSKLAEPIIKELFNFVDPNSFKKPYVDMFLDGINLILGDYWNDEEISRILNEMKKYEINTDKLVGDSWVYTKVGEKVEDLFDYGETLDALIISLVGSRDKKKYENAYNLIKKIESEERIQKAQNYIRNARIDNDPKKELIRKIIIQLYKEGRKEEILDLLRETKREELIHLIDSVDSIKDNRIKDTLIGFYGKFPTMMFTQESTACCTMLPDGIKKEEAIKYQLDPRVITIGYIFADKLEDPNKAVEVAREKGNLDGIVIGYIGLLEDTNEPVLVVDSVEGQHAFRSYIEKKFDTIRNDIERVAKEVGVKYVFYNKYPINSTPQAFIDKISDKMKEVHPKIKSIGDIRVPHIENFSLGYIISFESWEDDFMEKLRGGYLVKLKQQLSLNEIT